MQSFEEHYRQSEMEKSIEKINRLNSKIISIAISSKDVVIGLRNDGKLCKYNFETKKWEEA